MLVPTTISDAQRSSSLVKSRTGSTATTVSKCLLLLLEVGFAEKFSSTKYNAKCMTYNFIQVLGRYILKRNKFKQVHTSYGAGTGRGTTK